MRAAARRTRSAAFKATAAALLGIVLLVALVMTAVAAENDPGHDNLYVLKLGDSNVTGSINISANLTAELVQATGRFFGPNIDIRGDGSGSTANNQIIGGSASLEISTTGDLYLDKSVSGGMVYIGTPSALTALNVSANAYVYGNVSVGGTLSQQGVGVCLANGTNCLSGNNSGNISAVAAGNGISVSNPGGPTATVSIDATTCVGGQYSYWNGSAWSCGTFTGGGNVSGGGAIGNLSVWTGTSTIGSGIIWANSTSVGIGTASPNATLDVNGNANIGGNLSASGVNISDSDGCVYLPGGGRLCGNSTCALLYSPNGNTVLQACN